MKATSTLIDGDVLGVLRAASCTDHKVYLPPAQLERGLYVRVNEVLTRLGGQWQGGKVKAHVFEDDPAATLAECLATGIMPAKNPLAFWRTPDATIARMLDLLPSNASLLPTILEPSAGDGAIVKALQRRFPTSWIDAVEFDPKLAAKLRLLLPEPDVQVYETDFLRHQVHDYAAVVMNPPFALERDALEYIAHIRHAYDLLRPGGTLVAIAPAGLRFRTDKRTSALREFIDENGYVEELPSGAFEVSGTLVATVLVYMRKG